MDYSFKFVDVPFCVSYTLSNCMYLVVHCVILVFFCKGAGEDVNSKTPSDQVNS